MILLDTSGLLAAIDRSQSHHEAAASALRHAMPPRLLSPFVLAELDYWCSRRLPGEAWLVFLEDVIDGAYRVEPPTPGGWGDYPIDELAIRDEPRTAVDVVRRIEKGRFVLDPDFQRDFVWSETKQSRLIESILMRIPLPVFYVAEDAEGRLIVVDGRQRVTTLDHFLNDKLTLDLPDRKDLHGKKFSQLEARLQNRVEDCQLRFYKIFLRVLTERLSRTTERVVRG